MSLRSPPFITLASAALAVAALLSAPPVPPAPLQAAAKPTFAWTPEASPEGAVQVVISRSAQRLAVYRNGVRIGESDVSTGRPGYRTPIGSFTVMEKKVVHFSSTYDNAPMPYMQRLTSYGVAMHAGSLPGYPASHGCIRLPPAFAPLLYGATRIGTPVTIADTPGLGPLSPALTAELASAPPAGLWRPERASLRPVSIVASLSSRTVVAIGAGQLIGVAPLPPSPPPEGIFPMQPDRPPIELPPDWMRELGAARPVLLVTAQPLTAAPVSTAVRAAGAKGCAAP